MASKSKSRRRVFRASCILAALIVAGSSFAWFTSRDEVTNRLSAAADYGVAIAEDFQPPENWIPGQAVNKDAGAVNTGNVDAFTRMWVEGEMSVLARTNQNNSAAATGATLAKITPVTDEKYKALNLNYYNADSGMYYRELSKDKVKNPELNDSSDAAESDNSGNTENQPATFSEVQAMQAGAFLSYAPADAKYYTVLEHATTIKAYPDTGAGTAAQNYELKEGDIVATKGVDWTGIDTTGKNVVYIDNGTYGLDIDCSEFYPQTEGVYLFRRNVDLNSTANAKDDYEYSGYYYVPKGGTNLLATADSANDHYFKLFTDGEGKSDYTVPDNAVSDATEGDVVAISNNVVKVQPTENMKFFNAKEKVVKNSDLKWTYTAADAGTGKPAKLTAYYAGADGALGKTVVPAAGTDPAYFNDTSKDDVVVDVILANIGSNSEEWFVKAGNTTNESYYAPDAADPAGAATTLATNGLWTFYYNNDLESGDTTTKLIDSVVLSKDTTQDAFLAFDFDLNVFLESIQVTMDENGKETAESVTAWAATDGKNTGATAGTVTYETNNDYEIKNANWG